MKRSRRTNRAKLYSRFRKQYQGHVAGGPERLDAALAACTNVLTFLSRLRGIAPPARSPRTQPKSKGRSRPVTIPEASANCFQAAGSCLSLIGGLVAAIEVATTVPRGFSAVDVVDVLDEAWPEQSRVTWSASGPRDGDWRRGLIEWQSEAPGFAGAAAFLALDLLAALRKTCESSLEQSTSLIMEPLYHDELVNFAGITCSTATEAVLRGVRILLAIVKAEPVGVNRAWSAHALISAWKGFLARHPGFEHGYFHSRVLERHIAEEERDWHRRGCPSTARPIPRWDGEARTLHLGDRKIRVYSNNPADNQLDLIEAFHRKGWEKSILDPFRNADKLHRTIVDLNRTLPKDSIRFARDGTGIGARWDYAF